MLYHAYGLVLDSELALPELRPADVSADGAVAVAVHSTADVTIRFGPVERREVPLDDGGNGFWADEEGRWCHYRQDTAACLVTGGREITVDREGDPDVSLLQLHVLGPAMGLALMQRGQFLLHGSSVALNGKAVVFLGSHAAGKSTMAASLHARGNPLITDDIAILEPTRGDVHVMPSFPQLKLWDDSARDLGLQPAAMPRIHPDFDKWAWRLDAGMADEPLPLGRLYVLGVGEEIRIDRMAPQLGTKFVMSNWYGARFGNAIFKALDQGRHFRQCVEVADSVPICQLLRPKIESGFADLAAEIEQVIYRDLADS